jgi:hypothetical protein
VKYSEHRINTGTDRNVGATEALRMLHLYNVYLLQDVQSAFPSAQHQSMHESPESANDIWVYVSVPDDDTAIAVSTFSAIREIEVLLQTGYKITMMPFVAEEAESAL